MNSRAATLALNGGADFWRSRDRRFQVGRGSQSIEDRTRDGVVDFRGAVDVHRIANYKFEEIGRAHV